MMESLSLLGVLKKIKLPPLKNTVVFSSSDSYGIGEFVSSEGGENIIESQGDEYSDDWNLAILYSHDVASCFDKVICFLNALENGTKDRLIVLDIIVAPGSDDDFKDSLFQGKSYNFPTYEKLISVLEGFSWKQVNKGILPPEGACRSFVFHIRKKRPYAYLLMGPPGSGKSTIGKVLAEKSAGTYVSGDVFYKKISEGRTSVGAELGKIIDDFYDPGNVGRLTKEIIKREGVGIILDLLAAQSERGNLIVDCFIPQSNWAEAEFVMRHKGYFPVVMQWGMDKEMHSFSFNDNRFYIFKKRYLKLALVNIRRFFKALFG